MHDFPTAVRCALGRGPIAYVFAAAVEGLAFAILFLAGSTLDALPSAPYLFGVFVVAWVSGLGPAIVASAIAGALLAHFHLPAVQMFSPTAAIDVGLFVVLCVGTAVLVDRHRRHAAERDELLSLREHHATALAESQRVLSERVEELETIFDVAPVGLAIADDPRSESIRINRRLGEILGVASHRVPSLAGAAAAWELLHADLALCADEDPMRRTIATGRPLALELVVRRRDGSSASLQMLTAPLFDGAQRPRGCIAMAVDMTERCRLEAERRDSLAREQAARRSAEAASLAKDHFLATVGHELRNPIAAVASVIKVLQQPGADRAVLARAHAIAARQVGNLTRLMDDLLDTGRAATGRMVLDRRPLDLLAASHAALGTLRAAGVLDAHAPAVNGEPVWIQGDPTRIDQVITNLLGNAVKYTPPGGAIAVTVFGDGGEAVLRVQDTGSGIEPDLLPRVFDLFVQGERTSAQRRGGLGIGLTLVKRLVELHGGTVQAASDGVGKGSVFTVRWPAIPAPAAAASPTLPATSAVTARRVLIVEDNDDARHILTQLLEIDGHTVFEAADGEMAVQEAVRWQPDVALVDLGLPRMDGFEVARRLRTDRRSSAVRLVALTGYGYDDDMQRAREAGFDDFIVKPAGGERLARAISGSTTRAA